MSKELNHKLLKLFGILSTNSRLPFYNSNKVKIITSNDIALLDLSETNLITPIGNFESFFRNRRSPLLDSFVNDTDLQNFINKLTENNSIIRLNHVGLCYEVSSQNEEKTRLINLTKKTKLALYEEKSNDAGLWLFLGDLTNWKAPLLEFLPVEETKDEWIDYWLPHTHIDVDTNLDASAIEKLATTCFRDTLRPFRVTIIDNVVYTVRLRLGVIDGVNIDLDIATNSRRVEFMRTSILKRLP